MSQTAAASKRLTITLLAIPVRLLAALKEVSKAAAREKIRIAMMTNSKEKGKA